jgi:hypothetical protein
VDSTARTEAKHNSADCALFVGFLGDQHQLSVLTAIS